MYQPVTRNGVDTAEPLGFDQRPVKNDLTITIAATIDGFPTEICYTGSIDQLLNVTKRLRELGAAPTIAPAAPVQQGGTHAARKPASAVTYADDGTPVCANANCSRHGQPLEPSQHNGYYCKGKDSRTGNAKGYCKSTAE